MIHLAGYVVNAWFALAVVALLACWGGFELAAAVWARRIRRVCDVWRVKEEDGHKVGVQHFRFHYVDAVESDLMRYL